MEYENGVRGKSVVIEFLVAEKESVGISTDVSADLAPSDLHLFGALKDAIRGAKFETDDNVIHAVITLLLEQHMAHTHSSLVPGRTNGRRLRGKIGYGDKPSLFLTCSFHGLGVNIY
jgi:hypothetical protein